MSSPIADLETWWLTSGFEHLEDLVEVDSLGLCRQQVGFVQAIQQKLRAFDGNRDIYNRLVAEVSTPKTLSCPVNPRRQLSEVLVKIFRRVDDGGLDHDLAFGGLATLEQVETQRSRLAEATILALSACPLDDSSIQLVEGLHEKANERYRQFQLRFRACVSGFLYFPSHRNLRCCY